MDGKKRRATDENVLELTFEEWFDIHGERYRNLAGIRHHLNNEHGKGNWGDDEFVQYMLELYNEGRERAELALAGETEKKTPVLPPDATVEARIKAYLDFYENAAPNDMVMIENMAAMEVSLHDMRGQLRAEMSTEKPARTAVKGWTDMIRNLTREHRQIQETLGISRAGRDKEDRGADQVEYVRNVMRKSAAFVKEHAIQIRCSNCLAETGAIEINMGFILFHFRDDVPWKFECGCPRCGAQITLP